MKSPAQKPLKNIEKHITKKESSAPISTRDKTISTFKPSRILEEAE